MKTVKVTCDVCHGRVKRDGNGERNRLSVQMRASGYGLCDGDHRYRYDICSAKCGLIALKAIVTGIEHGEEVDFLPALHKSEAER